MTGSRHTSTGTTSTPVWLLDVDGVLNCSGRCDWNVAPRTGQAFADGYPFSIRWAPEPPARITALHDSGSVEIRWATTWIDHGTWQIEELLGLPEFPHAYPTHHRTAKLKAALGVVTLEQRPLIWTDDDAIPVHGRAREVLDVAGSLLIAPDERRGLRPEHLDAIDAFLRKAPQATPR
jgi:hypothetical protein